MGDTSLIRCGGCRVDLPASAFAPSSRTTGAYCRACASAYQKNRWASRHDPRVRRPPLPAGPRGCEQCGDVFERWDNYGSNPGIASSHCRPCYNAKSRERYAKKTGRVLRQRRAPGPDYRPQGKRWQELRAVVLAEESNCGICGDPVDKSLPHLNRLAATIDHITPLALGGDYYERANLRLAHRSCNARDGNRMRERVALDRIAELEARVLELEVMLGLHPRLFVAG